MKRAVSLILIVALLVSQSLVSLSHTHAVGSSIEHGGRSLKPHVHLVFSSHAGHHHEHEKQPSGHDHDSDQQGSDHDSDALYIGEIHLLSDIGQIKLTSLEFAVTFLLHNETACFSSPVGSAFVAPSPHLNNRCKLFLQHLSIRC